MEEKITSYRPCAMCGATRYQVSDFWWYVECVACGHMTDPEVVREDGLCGAGAVDKA